MSKSPKRARRVADLIHHQLARLLQREINDPRLGKVSLTGVVVSVDLSQAKVFYTLLDKKDLQETQIALNKASGYCRHLLAKVTALRYVPQLHFIYDESIDRGSRMSEIINKAIDADEKQKPAEKKNESSH